MEVATGDCNFCRCCSCCFWVCFAFLFGVVGLERDFTGNLRNIMARTRIQKTSAGFCKNKTLKMKHKREKSCC